MCCRFMWEYTTFLQFAKIILASQVLQALGVPYNNLVVYMAAAPLLAAFRLFYFGTYLPHLPPDNATTMNWQKSHSSEGPSWLTFLTCYHFGLHWEHHRWVGGWVGGRNILGSRTSRVRHAGQW
jgi:beta-carotene ketolase (CrtW type)